MPTNMKVFRTLPEAMQYIIAEKLSPYLSTIENTLTEKGVIKIKETTIFIDADNLLG